MYITRWTLCDRGSFHKPIREDICVFPCHDWLTKIHGDTRRYTEVAEGFLAETAYGDVQLKQEVLLTLVGVEFQYMHWSTLRTSIVMMRLEARL